VGHLVKEHRQELLVRALDHPDAPEDLLLVLVGSGVSHRALARSVSQRGLADRVLLVGPVKHDEVPWWLGAADMSLLLSEREGCPNIVLESAACGIPCLLTNLPEMREMLDLGIHGRLVDPDEGAIAHAMGAVLRGACDRLTLDRSVRTWDHVAQDLIRRFQVVLGHPARMTQPVIT